MGPRKRNIVRRFFRSSYAIGLMVKPQKISLDSLTRATMRTMAEVSDPANGYRMRRHDHRFWSAHNGRIIVWLSSVADFLGRDISDISLSA